MNEEEAIRICKKIIKQNNEIVKQTRKNKDINAMQLTANCDKESIAIETVLNLLENKDKQIEQYQNMLATNDMLHVIECEKKDKIINSIKEYAQQEIDFATEDIEDYIDDDREGNKDIIGELKEWREHWKDIIRIMNNKKTYMDFEYKVEEDK